ncbi:trans-1,2-dihydrobenzene-1,2-diol dehydrogenase-like [Arctopsyche grandis]|uniref:trans-1,2-dihydrobenzene-1,2-diol dehydrogenase-like n=1 Tax=Arctopsyche grandis TaxID=121162 RepID=UPI00406D99D1
MALRWGIASAGKISNDFVTAVKLLPKEDHEIVAVAARKLESAKAFASRFDIKNAYQGYECLAKSSEIDIVYIGTLHPQHFETAKLMLDNNKNVLCEKPLCMNYKEAKTLVDLAKKKNLFFMEAVWSRCFPAYAALKEYIKSGALGEVYQVYADFGQPISEVPRLNTKELGGGTVLDIGIYPLQFSQMIFGSYPQTIVAAGHLNDDGVDLSMSCVLTYAQGGTATLTTHSRVQLPNEAIIVGTKGTARLPSFWCPTRLQLGDGTWKEFPLPKARGFVFTNSAGLMYEAEECRQCIKNGLKESSKMPHEESLNLAKLEDAIRKQIGVHYKQDD